MVFSSPEVSELVGLTAGCVACIATTVAHYRLVNRGSRASAAHDDDLAADGGAAVVSLLEGGAGRLEAPRCLAVLDAFLGARLVFAFLLCAAQVPHSAPARAGSSAMPATSGALRCLRALELPRLR